MPSYFCAMIRYFFHEVLILNLCLSSLNLLPDHFIDYHEFVYRLQQTLELVCIMINAKSFGVLYVGKRSFL